MDLTSLPILETIERSEVPLISEVAVDEYTQLASKSFDYEFVGQSVFYPYNKPTKLPKEFNIGLIVGSSGTGKSTLLKEFGEEEIIEWDNDKSIISHFSTPQEGVARLSSVGLNSIPTWCKPFQVLSNGEKFRAEVARRIKDNAVIDEFTSVVDRSVAKACSTSISKYIKKNDIKNVVFSTCHYDIAEWLEPDWIFDSNVGVLYSGYCLRRPRIELDICKCEVKDIWAMFKNHHYLSHDLNKSAQCYVASWNNNIVAFGAILAMPSGTLKNAFREHRIVVLPDYQGMGIGVAFSDALGEIYTSQGKKYYSRSAHIRFGHHRETSGKWLASTTNKMQRKETHHNQNYNNWLIDTNRACFSHQYVGQDYYQKPHCNILFHVTKDIDYDKFKQIFKPMVDKLQQQYYVVFYSGQTKSEDTVAEKLSKELGIRNELYPKLQVERGNINDFTVCIDIGDDDESIKELFLSNKKYYKNIKP